VDLRIRKEEGQEAEFRNKINTLRSKIDIIDHQIIEHLGKRMRVAD
ncbi:MAG TPA: 3-deoxy-7-phosphoheptulonate synthase, partial [Flavobacteriaceae bacterium]|nr:3-deoxy-7-phosphoheptulonate synthase [Flavobacteriaceae bacterium]